MKFIFFITFLSTFLSGVSIEEKVGAILMCPIHGEEVTEQVKSFLKETKISGIILYNWSNDITSSKKIRPFIKALQKESIENTGSPLFIGIDQEGGRVDRLKKGYPSAEKIAKTMTPGETFVLAQEMAEELHFLGINLNFAPVVDINSNPENRVIGDRSFGKDPKIVTAFGQAFAKGLQNGNVFPCLKHFPGHGDVSDDSHYTLPVSYKTLNELMEMELIPYMEIDSPFIMTAHILFPHIDPNYPATLSKIFLQDILREKLGYKGLIITDSLRMDAIATESLGEVAIDAFNAGNDILLIGGSRLVENDPGFNMEQVKEVHLALVEAVKKRRISEERLNESFQKIQVLKESLKNGQFQNPIDFL
ncbi:MAG: Beta-hexosaminidase [Chlamydiia bacterium]|nr:Beta-hexosaminidase [Chlamydiia bacterium]